MRDSSSVPNQLRFSHDGRYVSACLVHPWHGGEIWNLDTGQEVVFIESRLGGNAMGHQDAIFNIAMSPESQLAATASFDSTVRLWDMSTGELLNVLKGHVTHVYTVAFSPDGRTLASGGEEDEAKLWHVATGRIIGTIETGLKPILYLDFSPDGSMLAAGSRNHPHQIRLFHAPRGTALAPMP